MELQAIRDLDVGLHGDGSCSRSSVQVLAGQQVRLGVVPDVELVPVQVH